MFEELDSFFHEKAMNMMRKVRDDAVNTTSTLRKQSPSEKLVLDV